MSLRLFLNIITLYPMNENFLKPKLVQEKPININISFNINRKKLKDETKNTQLQSTYNQKGKSIENELKPKSKTRNQVCQQQKLSDFSYEDNKNIDKQVDGTKKNQQEKKKKKSKRGYSDFASSKTESLLGYPSQFLTSVNTHRRGHTTSFIKKQSILTSKKFKNGFLGYQQTFKTTSAFSSFKRKKDQQKYTDGKKSLKQTISKIIKNEFDLSNKKRKIKGTFSAELTSKNMTESKPKKRRSSKSQILKSQNYNSAKKRQIFNQEPFQDDDFILQKLGNFKSMENSLMMTQIDLDDEFQDHLNLKSKKLNPRNKIYIRTDQSIQCIDQIHEFQHQKFKKQFFNQNGSIEKRQNVSDTKTIIKNFINIFSLNQISNQNISVLDPEQQNAQKSLQIRQTVNENIFDSNMLFSPQSSKIKDSSLTSPLNLSKVLQLQISGSKQVNFEQNKNKNDVNFNVNNDIISENQQKTQSIVSEKSCYDSHAKNKQEKFNNLKQCQGQKLTFLLDYLKLNINKKPNQQVLLDICKLLQQPNFHSFNKKEKNNKSHQLKEEEKYVEFEQYSSLDNSDKKSNNDIHSNNLNNKKKSTIESNKVQDEIEQIRSFKDDYESQQSYKDIISMNLETVQKAFKNRIKVLQEKRQKELHKLQQNYQQFKINQSQYIQTKNKIQKWFTKEIDQISTTKRNIFKGYHQAKKIIQKDNQNLKCENTQNSSKKYQKDNLHGLSQGRESKIIKCLSESILKKKKSLLNVEGNKVENKIKEKNQTKSNSKKQKSVQKTNKVQDKIVNETNKMKKIDLFGQKKETNNEDEQQNTPRLNKYVQEKQRLSESSQFSDLSQNSFIEKKKVQQTSKDLYEYHQQKSNENLFKKISQKETDSSNIFEQSDSPKQSKSNKVPTQQNTQNQFFQVNTQAINSKYNSNQIKNIKFKYLNEDDRQDIFQFVFLDLCIEIYQDTCNQNKIMNCINKFIIKSYEMSKRKKGIKTNLNVVKDYLKRFCGYVLRTNKNTLSNLNFPMGPTALEMLKYMHENQEFQNDQFQDNSNAVPIVIPVSIFDTFQKSLLPTIQFQHYYDEEEKQKERVYFLKNVLHIHNKAIYDALNEFLDNQRPFGVWGKPFPWKKATSFSHLYTEKEQQQKLRKSAQKVVESCSYVCGLMVDKEQSLISNAKVSQAYIEQIKQDRISRMLANDMVESQERWLFYDDQQTQVLVESGQDIFNRLLFECIEQMAFLQSRKIKI